MNFRCESQDELEQLNKSTSQNSFEKNNLYPWTMNMWKRKDTLCIYTSQRLKIWHIIGQSSLCQDLIRTCKIHLKSYSRSFKTHLPAALAIDAKERKKSRV